MPSSRTIEVEVPYPNNSTSCNVLIKSEFNGVSLSGALKLETAIKANGKYL